MRILVIGGGAREHALCRSFSLDPEVAAVHCAPGNAGIAEVATLHAVDAHDGAAVADLAQSDEVRADLVVVGPEAPLVAGVADVLRERGVAVFGPSGDAALLEGSKAFAKDVMAGAGVPTARSYVCTTEAEVDAALDAFGPPYVVKDDGLAAGKGVVVTEDPAAARAHALSCVGQVDGQSGTAGGTQGGAGAEGGRVVIEEFLDGPEVSLFAVTDGETVVPLQPAQDFKRAYDADEGPNTGGMGAYSPLPWAGPKLVEEIEQTVLQPTVDELARRGTPFSGLLYAGLALTSRGVRVIEFNARFGDPETQAVLARLQTPLAGLLHAAATGRLAVFPPLRWSDEAAVTVVVAAHDYPAKPRTGDVIEGLDEVAAQDAPGAYVLHAGTARDDQGRVLSAGGRVLSVTATGSDLTGARERAYTAVDRIRLEGSHHRTDIAAAAARGADGGADT